jgi:hypothetical protein
LVSGPALLLRHQRRSQREACAERPGKQPWQTICSDEIHFFVTPLPKLDARSPAKAYYIDGVSRSPSQVLTQARGKSYSCHYAKTIA